MCIFGIMEEIFPFWNYITGMRRQRRRYECHSILDEQAFSEFGSLSETQLMGRLKEEHQRASSMDDKTFKLTISLSVGLTVLGSTAATLIRAVSWEAAQITISVFLALGLFYVLAAGFVALGALRTVRTYGYGTDFLLQQQGDAQNVLADALARQETVNNIRHLRNETAYQALRNGLLLIFVALLIFAATLAFQSLCPLVTF